ncbi:DNA-binding NarL/FixJ family response regulator [Hamadaea flava]|uniref:DNA-binding response regulator n=2 Tax=Hamadaea flava TaxID=1742688 RepID=A0ABV8LDW7_9ACTN|nr:response regulator transcription factor [Hamadaea flava]MCP2323434.1 DNA-binding NarL/FixJ family response regulator [Hamadaea flava]
MIAHEPDIELVAQPASEAEAWQVIAEKPTDVVALSTIAVPDAADLAVRLRRAHPQLGIVLIGDTDDALLLWALQTGLSALLSWSASPAQIIATVRHAAVSPAGFTASGLAGAIAREDVRLTTLTSREAQILCHLQAGTPTDGIAADLHLSVSTVRTYIARLYAKLGAGSRRHALDIAHDQELL